MGCFSPDLPPAPNYGQITRDTLQAQVDLAPQQYQSEAQFQPLYSNLELGNLNTLLNGTAGGTVNTTTKQTAGQTGWYDTNTGKFISAGVTAPLDAQGNSTAPLFSNGMIPGEAPAPGAVWVHSGRKYDVNGTTTTPAQQGLFSLMQQQATQQRTGDITDVSNLGLKAHDAMLSANPESAALLAKLNAQANQGLDFGSGLTPEEQRAMQQQSRAAFAARGMGGSNASVSDELLKQFDLGQQLLRQRQQFAQSLIGTNQSVVGDPFAQILGRNSGAVNQAFQGQQQAGPALFNPSAGLGLAQSNYATQSQFAAANNPLATIGGILGGVGKAASGIATAFCWVAREVYGVENPQWLVFREWMLNEAPAWFRKLYLAHGERFAAWLKRNPWLKPAIRHLMDRAVAKPVQPLTA